MDKATYDRLLAKAQRTSHLFTFDEFLRFWAADRPDRLAMEGDDLRFDYAGLEDATARVASALLAHCLDEARGQGVKLMKCQSSLSGTPFYEAFGFRQIGRVMTSVAGNPLPAIEMELAL